jgi:CBS domain-containing protein
MSTYSFEPDSIEEELAIMDERSEEDVHGLTLDHLLEPVERICRKRAEVLDHTATIGEAIGRMQQKRIGSLAVVKDGVLVGIVTERDILRKVVGPHPVAGESASITEVMTKDPETLRPSDAILFLLNKMQGGGFRHVPVVDVIGRPLYVLSIRDVLNLVLERFHRRVSNLPSEPYHGDPQLDVGYG